MSKNATMALYEILHAIDGGYREIEVRGKKIWEILSYLVEIECPLERVILHPHRKNNTFAAIAETMWVLAGRNDIAYLGHYLPRAKNFSDDGRTWRGGYGPRLRNWRGTDQIKNVIDLLNFDRATRRAVMVIFDPELDFIDSKDIPCNNWIHFIIREDKLHMNVSLRSNDAIWGFSGINTFEWSYLHEMMAFWTNSKVGKLSYFVGSFHVYKRYLERMNNILNNIPEKTLYDYGFKSSIFNTPFSDFDQLLEKFFSLEMEARNGNFKKVMKAANQMDDELIRNSIKMLNIYNALKLFEKNGENKKILEELISDLNVSDFRIAALEFVFRKIRSVDLSVNLTEAEKEFFSCFNSENDGGEKSKDRNIFEIISMLHRKKSAVYGDSWKKHGEIISIFANISRKFDRLEVVLNGKKATNDETVYDTIADLAVYSIKYITFLSENYDYCLPEFLSRYSENGRKGVPAKCREFEEIMTILRNYYNSHDSEYPKDRTGCWLLIENNYSKLEKILTKSGSGKKQDLAKYISAMELAINSLNLLQLECKRNPTHCVRFGESIMNL
jgi:thymidylate synthase